MEKVGKGVRASGEDGQNLKEVDAYVKKHDIQQLLKDSIVQLCINRPDNPYTFLREHFETLEKVSSEYRQCHNLETPRLYIFFLPSISKQHCSEFNLPQL